MKRNFTQKTAVLPEGLWATYDVHLRFIGKHVVDFLLVLIELFSLGVMAEVLRANMNWESVFFLLSRCQFGQNFRYKGSSPINHSLYRKTRINVLLCGIRMWAQVSFVLSQCTCMSDGQTERPFLYHPLHCMHSHSKNYIVWVKFCCRIVLTATILMQPAFRCAIFSVW